MRGQPITRNTPLTLEATGSLSTGSTSLELLAPAGNWECARAAVENGADAIYFGLDVGFNARARAANFSLADLSGLISFLHRHGVRGYVTLNTLIFSDELRPLLEHLSVLVDAGVDAVLVQDLGAARLMRAACPSLELHASTQMTLTSVAGSASGGSTGDSSCGAAPRIVDPRDCTAVGSNIAWTGGLCPRSPLRGLFRSVSDQRITGWPQREPGSVCSGLPPAVRSDLRRPTVELGDINIC